MVFSRLKLKDWGEDLFTRWFVYFLSLILEVTVSLRAVRVSFVKLLPIFPSRRKVHFQPRKTMILLCSFLWLVVALDRRYFCWRRFWGWMGGMVTFSWEFNTTVWKPFWWMISVHTIMCKCSWYGTNFRRF